jgi:hypothetical protein
MSRNGFGPATALLLDSHVSADSFRSALANDSLLGFLALLVLLLAAVLIVVIRLPPYQSAPPAEDRQDDADSAESLPLSAYPQLPVPGSAAAPLNSAAAPSGPARLAGSGRSAIPVRVPSQPGQRGYAARHAPGHGPGPEQDTVSLPKVSGSPPWGPAPKPPGMR